MRMKGIVLDINEQGAIVVDNEGKYTKIKHNDQLVIGVLVEYTEKDVVGLEKMPILGLISGKGKFIYPAACAAILILIIGILGIVTNKSVNSTFAYIDVDINPSIELKVNQDECIIGVKTLNKDSEKLCENIDFIGKKAESGVVDIINKSLEMGYFHDDKKIVMVAGALKVNGKLASDKYEKLNDKMGSLIEKIKNKVSSGKEDVELVAFHTSPLKLKEAQKKNISLGRYSIYANAENEGIKLALDDAKKLKISELFNLLPDKDFTYFEKVQRQAAIDVKLIKKEEKDRNKYASSEENKKNEKTDQTSNNKGLNKNKHNIETRKPADSDDEEIKNTPKPSATAPHSKNSNKHEDTKNNNNSETSNNNQSNDDSSSNTDRENTSTSENNKERNDNTNNNDTNNNNSNNSNTVEKDAQNNNNNTQNNGQSNNSSNVSSTESNNNNGNDKNNGNDNGKSHGNKNKNTTNDIQSTPTPIVEANTTTSIVHPTMAQTPEVTQNTPAPVQTPSPVVNESSATVDNTNKNDNSKNDSAPGHVKKENKTENGNQNKNKNR